MYDVTIIGGGFYGCMIALHFSNLGKKVLVVEKENDIMLKASFNNQARVHNGYHYPRAVKTAQSSHRNYSRFIAEFSSAINNTHLMTYVIAKGSKTDPKKFEDIYNQIGSPLLPPQKEVLDLLNKDLIEKVYTVEEKVFDADILRSIIWQRLKNAQIEVICNTEVIKVSKGKLSVRNNMSVTSIIESTRIINCGYAGINNLLIQSGLPEIPIKTVSTVMPLIDVPKEFKNLGVTIMDGPFLAVMPFPPLGLHTIHHVRLTPSEGEHQQEIIDDAARFIPCLNSSRHMGSIKEVKALLLENNFDDGRPSLFKNDYGFEGFDIVVGAKIDNIYEILDMFENGDNTNLNVVV